MDIALNTLLGLDLFSDKIRDSFILHIPHSSDYFPNLKGFTDDKIIIENELMQLTDWATDKIFSVPDITTLKADFSRIFCDVERFCPDEFEPMANYGRGFYYTQSDLGEFLRTNESKMKDLVYENYYKPYHDNFANIVEKKLEYGVVHIIDCHSFNNTPLKTDLNKLTPRPDICIGTDEFHTPDYLTDQIYNLFTNHGFSVLINLPYSGTIVPKKFYRMNPNVHSLMIEVNKKLYMDDDLVDAAKVRRLNELIQDIF